MPCSRPCRHAWHLRNATRLQHGVIERAPPLSRLMPWVIVSAMRSRHGSLAASVTALVAACGARTGLLVSGEGQGGSGVDGGRYSDSGDDGPGQISHDALPPIDVTVPVDALSECPDASSTLVYVIGFQNTLMSFYPRQPPSLRSVGLPAQLRSTLRRFRWPSIEPGSLTSSFRIMAPAGTLASRPANCSASASQRPPVWRPASSTDRGSLPLSGWPSRETAPLAGRRCTLQRGTRQNRALPRGLHSSTRIPLP